MLVSNLLVFLPQWTLNPLDQVSPVLHSFDRLSITCLSFFSVLIPMVTSACERLTSFSDIVIAAFCVHMFYWFILSQTLPSLKVTG